MEHCSLSGVTWACPFTSLSPQRTEKGLSVQLAAFAVGLSRYVVGWKWGVWVGAGRYDYGWSSRASSDLVRT